MIAIAPNAFRGSLTATQAASLIEQGLKQSRLSTDTILMPLADGGNGTLDIWLAATGGQRFAHTVMGPLGEPVTASFGIKNATALIEMAQASGIELVQRPDPMRATTYGTGQLIQAAIERGATTILVGLGGSATIDGGAGCLQALGAQLLNQYGQSIGLGGGALGDLASINIMGLPAVDIQVLCDVDNPLLGPEGALVFARQKGATSENTEQLALYLEHFTTVVEHETGLAIGTLPKGGAAGGLSAGLQLAGATLVSGAARLMNLCGYDKRFAQGDIRLVITGEGQLDSQTLHGKASYMIAQTAAHYHIPVVALAGSVQASAATLSQAGITAAWSIVPTPCTLEQALEHAPEWLTEAATHLGNFLASMEWI